MFTGKKIKTFQQRFTELVEDSGKSLLQLSKDLHVSNQTLSAWRNGTRSPKLPTVISIADHFKVRPEWLMGYDVEKDEPEEEPKQIVIPDSELFKRIMLELTPYEYETVMDIFNAAERRLRKKGDL